MNEIVLSKVRKRKNLNKLKRDLVESKGCCEICKHNFKPILQIHHIEPVSTGGSDNPDNLLILCPNCHKTIHAIDSDWSYDVYGSDYFDEWFDENISEGNKQMYLYYALKIVRSRYPNVQFDQ